MPHEKPNHSFNLVIKKFGYQIGSFLTPKFQKIKTLIFAELKLWIFEFASGNSKRELPGHTSIDQKIKPKVDAGNRFLWGKRFVWSSYSRISPVEFIDF